MKNSRKIQLSVNNFIYYKDEYLLLKRNLDKRIDPGKLNTIGGKVEKGETFLDAVIRETKEESGIEVTPQQVKFVGLMRIEEGYEEDWIMAFFKTELSNKQISHGTKTEDGELVWLSTSELLSRKHDLVDDLYYTMEKIAQNNSVVFANFTMDSNLKVADAKVSEITN